MKKKNKLDQTVTEEQENYMKWFFDNSCDEISNSIGDDVFWKEFWKVIERNILDQKLKHMI